MLMISSLKHAAVLTAMFTAGVTASGQLFKIAEYETFREEILSKFPVEGREVYNTYTETRVPLIGSQSLTEQAIAETLEPDYCGQAGIFMRKHKYKNFSNLQYGKDFVYALHATDEGGYHGIKQTGLRESTGAGVMCQDGIYLTKHTGICKNALSEGTGSLSEYTTLRYGSNTGASPFCYFALVLVMNPKVSTYAPDSSCVWRFVHSCYQAVTKAEQRQCTEWLVAPKSNALVLKLFKVDTKQMAKGLFASETKRYKMKQTPMHKTLSPTSLKLSLLAGRRNLRKRKTRGTRKL